MFEVERGVFCLFGSGDRGSEKSDPTTGQEMSFCLAKIAKGRDPGTTTYVCYICMLAAVEVPNKSSARKRSIENCPYFGWSILRILICFLLNVYRWRFCSFRLFPCYCCCMNDVLSCIFVLQHQLPPRGSEVSFWSGHHHRVVHRGTVGDNIGLSRVRLSTSPGHQVSSCLLS